MKRVFIALYFALAVFGVGLAWTQDISNPQTNASALTSGTVAAARMPALTGDCTTSAGAVATTCTGINGVNMNSAWSTYTPTATCATGSITTDTLSARYRFIGTKTVIVQFNVNISTVGTCSGNVTLTTPPSGTVNSTGGNYPGTFANLTALTSGILNVNGTGIVLFFATVPLANNYFGVITYEVQ